MQRKGGGREGDLGKERQEEVHLFMYCIHRHHFQDFAYNALSHYYAYMHINRVYLHYVTQLHDVIMQYYVHGSLITVFQEASTDGASFLILSSEAQT